MRIRRILALLLAGILMLTLCGCKGPEDWYDVDAAATMREEKQIYLTVWSWQIPNDAPHSRQSKGSSFFNASV